MGHIRRSLGVGAGELFHLAPIHIPRNLTSAGAFDFNDTRTDAGHGRDQRRSRESPLHRLWTALLQARALAAACALSHERAAVSLRRLWQVVRPQVIAGHLRCGGQHSTDARSDILKRHERSHSTPSGILTASSGASGGRVQDRPDTPSPVASSAADSDPLTTGSRVAISSWPASNAEGPSDPCLLLEDFDLDSLDTYLNDIMTGWVQGTNTSQTDGNSLSLAPPVPAQQCGSRTPNSDQESGLRGAYLTVDDQYSSDISHQLSTVPQPPDTVLSASYLSLCLQLYFTYFHPIFPIVHAPTFGPRAHNSLLLISMCSIGSLFIGHPEAVAQGQQLYSRLNKAILASWETHLSEPKRSSLPMVQAALLGQTFGMLSKRSADRFMTEAFQGTMLAWARSVGAFSLSETVAPPATHTGIALSNVWMTWARAEELRRLALALYIHDIEIACLFSREPYLRHQSIVYSLCSPDESFEASTAEEWQKVCLDQSHSSRRLQPVKIADWVHRDCSETAAGALACSIETSSFAAYASLANLGAYLVEQVQSGPLSSAHVAVHSSGLAKWYRAYLSGLRNSSIDSLCLRILWHHYSSLLYVDVWSVERSLDAQSEQSVVPPTIAWAASDRAACAMFHTFLLQKLASELPMRTIPPIHLPRTIFTAGVVFAAYSRFAPHANGRLDSSTGYRHLVSSWEDWMLAMPCTKLLAESEGQQPKQVVSSVCTALSQRTSSLPYGCIDLLRKLSRWGVSSVFADTLQSYLHLSPERSHPSSA